MQARRFILFVGVSLLTVAAAVSAETFQLDPQAGWVAVPDTPEGRYVLAMAQLRQTLATGKPADIEAALQQLKTDFPQIAGGDLDAFIDAERDYGKRHYGKAAKKYKQFLENWADSPLQPAAMERYFSIGAAFLQGQKRIFLGFLPLPAFDDGVEIMRDIADKAGNTPIALRALTTLAENQERRKKYLDAYQTWAEIYGRWTTGPEGQNALLRTARALHTSYKGTDYDASTIQSAKKYFMDYIQRYPQMAEQLQLSETVATIEEQLAYKTYQIGFYYERAGNREGAKRHYEDVLAKWPDSAAARMAQMRLSPGAPPAVKPTLQRKAFDGISVFLDKWFGVGLFFKTQDSNTAARKG